MFMNVRKLSAKCVRMRMVVLIKIYLLYQKNFKKVFLDRKNKTIQNFTGWLYIWMKDFWLTDLSHLLICRKFLRNSYLFNISDDFVLQNFGSYPFMLTQLFQKCSFIFSSGGMPSFLH